MLEEEFEFSEEELSLIEIQSIIDTVIDQLVWLGEIVEQMMEDET